METPKKTVGRTGIDYGLASAGVGYICIPRNYDRETYIKNCLANNTVCVRTENFEFLTDVYIDKSVLQNISFPKDRNENGSLVVWVKIAKHGLPVVVGTIDLKNNGQEVFQENSFNFVRKDEDGKLVSINGEPNDGLNIRVINDNENKGIDIKVLNKLFQSVFNLYIQGEINLNSEKNINVTTNKELNIKIKNPSESSKQSDISYKLGVGLSVKDEFKNQLISNKDGVQVKVPINKKIQIGTGQNFEPSVLGNQLDNSLNKIVDCFKDITTATERAEIASTGTPSNAAFKALNLSLRQLTAHVNELENLIKLNNSNTVQVTK